MRCGFLSGNLPKLRHPNEPIQPKRLYGIRGRSAEAHFRGGDCSDERCRTQVSPYGELFGLWALRSSVGGKGYLACYLRKETDRR